QWSNKADPCGPVDAGELIPRIAMVDIADRHPIEVSEFAIDPSRKRIQAGANFLIAAYILTRGRRDLKEEDFAVLMRVVAQEALISEKAFFEALRIIEPIDADDHVTSSCALPHPVASIAGGGGIGGL